jgi:hypothetical protein
MADEDVSPLPHIGRIHSSSNQVCVASQALSVHSAGANPPAAPDLSTAVAISIDGLHVSAPNAAKLAKQMYYVTEALEPDIERFRRCLNDEACWTVSSARPGNDIHDLLTDNVRSCFRERDLVSWHHP